MAGKVRSLSVVFQAFTDKFEAATDRASNKITGFGKRVIGAVAGFVAARAVLDKFGQSMENITRLGRISETLQVSPEFVRGIKLATEELGESFEKAEDVIKEFNIRMGEAATGAGPAINGLELLGMKIEDFAGMNPEESFLKVAEAIKNLDDPQLKIFTAGELFGGAGEDMLALLNQGEDGIRKFIDEARRLGGPISEGDIKRVQEANAAINRMGEAFDGIIGQLAISFAPILEDIADGMTSILTAGEGIANAWKETKLGIGAAYIELQRFLGKMESEEANAALAELYRSIYNDGGARKGFGAGAGGAGKGKGTADLPGIAQRNLSIKTFSEAATAQSSRAFDLLNPNQNVQQQQLTENKKTNTKLDQIKRELKNNGSGLARQDIPS